MIRMPKCIDIDYKRSFAYYIIEELGLDLNSIWNWNMNKVNPYKITKQSKNNIWLYCLKHDYHNYDRYGNKIGYKTTCNRFHHLTSKDGSCGYCNSFASNKVHWKDSFAQWGIDNFGEDFLKKYWSNYNIINPWELSPQSSKKIWIYCQEKDYHNDDGGYEIKCADFYGNHRCSYCGCAKKIHWKDSLAHNYPNIAKMIAIPENDLTFDDCYNIACHSNRKFYFKCLDCGYISSKKRTLKIVVNRGYSCEYCSDGISIPEKFMINVLNQLNEKFIPQLSKIDFKWCSSFRYDFYLPRINTIIETNGCQHYEECTLTTRTLEQEQWNDLFKYKCAKGHVDNYIVIDCRYSELKWLKENIIKELSDYFDLSNINWELVWEESQKSKCVETWKLYDNGLHNLSEIGRILKLSQRTIKNYMKRRVRDIV